MDNEKLASILQKAQSGDSEAMIELVISYQGLIFKIVHEHFSRLAAVYNSVSTAPLEKDDLLSIAKCAFIEAVYAFSPERGTNFTSFAAFRIRNELFEQIKKLQGPIRLPRHIFDKRRRLEKQSHSLTWRPASLIAASTYLSSCELSTQLPSGEIYDDLYRTELLNLISAAFSEKDKQLFALRLDGFSCKEIGELLNITQKQASKIFRRIIGNAHTLEELLSRLCSLRSPVPLPLFKEKALATDQHF